MKPLCVIPARAGSKRLPRKNVLPLGGKPMLGWSIEAALRSGIFDQVYVSTENEDIAELARGFGAAVPALRPLDLAGDTVTNVAVSLHLHDLLRERGLRYDAIVCLQPSSPLRTAADISQSWKSFVDEKRSFLVSVTPIDPHYFHWALSENDGDWKMFFGDRFMTVRQELPAVQRPNGAIKIAEVEALRAANNFFGDNLGVHVMPENASIHVATDFDLWLCESILVNGR
jgi:CMP-N,N'-diacetyllegionaminic acid synthase